MFAAGSVSFGYHFRVAISLRSVAGLHELAGESRSNGGFAGLRSGAISVKQMTLFRSILLCALMR